jgi:hypothetical protein
MYKRLIRTYCKKCINVTHCKPETDSFAKCINPNDIYIKDYFIFWKVVWCKIRKIDNIFEK